MSAAMRIDTSIGERRARVFRHAMLQVLPTVGLTVTLIKLLP
jgi:hypothetical protein